MDRPMASMPVGCTYSVHAREQGIWVPLRGGLGLHDEAVRIPRITPDRRCASEVERKALSLGPPILRRRWPSRASRHSRWRPAPSQDWPAGLNDTRSTDLNECTLRAETEPLVERLLPPTEGARWATPSSGMKVCPSSLPRYASRP